MNGSILVAAIALAVTVFARMFMGVLALLAGKASLWAVVVPLAIALLILLGILAGHRLAWQWGRLLGLAAGIILTLVTIQVLRRANGRPEVLVFGSLLALQGVPLFPMFFALGTQGAREHFRLICPQCGRSKPRGGNFLYTKVVCKECKTVWS